MNFKKLLAVVVVAISALFSLGNVQAQTYGQYPSNQIYDAANDCPTGCPGQSLTYTWATTTNPGTGGYSAAVNFNSGGTNYSFTVYAVNGQYSDATFASAYLTNTPWFTNSALALPTTAAVNTQLGYSVGAPPNIGALFAYSAPTGSSTVPVTFWMSSTPMSAPSGAPEIDGSLAPKVGFLLGCLFLMFRRKKQTTEPMLAV